MGRPEMSRSEAPRLTIRVGMDVYSAYQDEYIGAVIRVWQEDSKAKTPEARGATVTETGSSSQATENPDHAHEEGESVNPTGLLGSRLMLGEELGPFPTSDIGNSGPLQQSAHHEYGTEGADSRANVVFFAVRPGRVNLGVLTPPLYIPTHAVQSISMERVVLDVQKDQIPTDWRKPAALDSLDVA